MGGGTILSARAEASPSKLNPFARTTAVGEVRRASLLPPSPAKSDAVDATPARQTVTPKMTPGKGWRLLWRGGVEVGPTGWRLDGLTFYAPALPTQTPLPAPSNPFDERDADLCLALESLRGRKFLAVRGVETLQDDEELEDSGISLALSNPLLEAYFTGLLCRSPHLSPSGRTGVALAIGLGDEGLGDDKVLVFGQRTEGNVLRLAVGRRAAKVELPRVRPGEPLPRALVFPELRRPLGRALSRAASTSSVYAPAPLSLRPTPGRRGEKRRKEGEDEERRRKAGKIALPERDDARGLERSERERTERAERERSERGRSEMPDEDIFGRPRRAPSLAPSVASTSATRGTGVLLDNKAIVRKQAMLALEARGCARQHPEFKDVFGAVTRGVYFTFRHTLETSALDKPSIIDIVTKHADMYIAPILASDPPQPPRTPPSAPLDESMRTPDR